MKKPASIHHRKCRSNGGSNHQNNISYVTKKEHEAWHTLFFNWDSNKICQALNFVWCDPDYEFIVVRRR